MSDYDWEGAGRDATGHFPGLSAQHTSLQNTPCIHASWALSTCAAGDARCGQISTLRRVQLNRPGQGACQTSNASATKSKPTCELPGAGRLVCLGGGDVGPQELGGQQLLPVLLGGCPALLVDIQHVIGQSAVLEDPDTLSEVTGTGVSLHGGEVEKQGAAPCYRNSSLHTPADSQSFRSKVGEVCGVLARRSWPL